MDGLEFRILGTLEVWRDGTLAPVEAARQRDVLAALLLQPNQVVPVDRLIELVWGDDPPATALNTLHTLVRRLRRRLADEPAAAQQVLQTRPPGYRLAVAPDRLDLSRFEELLRRGRQALRGDDAALAARLLGDAVALWRGPALADVTSEWLLRVERPRLQELYLQAVEHRIEAQLRQGRHAEVLGELRRLVAEQPLRERPYGQLMTTLHRSGRQADALATYRTLRQTLADELGVEPEPALQQLHQAILRGDPELDAPRPDPDPAVVAGVRERLVPAQLPADVGAFTGRADELVRLDKLLADAREDPIPAVAVVGTAGVGKTALAVHWAHRVRERFPDGQLYIDLHGYATVAPLRPIDCLGQFLRALGVPPERVPADGQEAAGLYRTLMADRRLLVVLDNARGPDQVRPLLPGGSTCLALVTSRDRLDGLVARDGAQRLSLDVLAPSEAQILLRRTVGADRLAGGPGEAGGAVAELARLCGYLPLALRIAAANLSGRRIDVAAYAQRLRAGGELAGLAVTGDEQTAVRSAFSLSYSSLPDDAMALFRLLGAVPGADITVDAAAALAGTGPADAGRLLEVLAAAHLAHEPAPGRYTCHDLLRRYAVELGQARPEAERAAALGRLYDWYLAHADRAARLLYPEKVRLPGVPLPDSRYPDWADPSQALGWLEAEHRNLVTAVEYAAEHGPRPMAYRLADALRGYFLTGWHTADFELVSHSAAAAAEAEQDLPGQVASHLGLGSCLHQRQRYPAAIEQFRRAAVLAERAGWQAAHATALTGQGAIYGETGQLAEAAAQFSLALESHRRSGRLAGEALCVGNLGALCAEQGRLDEAAGHFERALEIDREQGSLIGQAYDLYNLGEVHLMRNRLDRARACVSEALARFREAGSGKGESESLSLLAQVHLHTGDHRRAWELAQAALAVAGELDADAGHARSCEALARDALGKVHTHTGAPQLAVAEHRRALELQADGGRPYAQTQTLLDLAAANLALGQPELAAGSAGRALTIARERGFGLLEAQTVEFLNGLS
jgi:DNA-binding SARP family transcriptional activator/tetratricopeptide (TPR) repeat protein